MKKALHALFFALMTVTAFAAPPAGITVSPAPVDGEWAIGTKWYFVSDTRPQGTFYWRSDVFHSSGSPYLCWKTMTQPSNTDDAGLWCIVGNDTDGYKFYNRASGASKALGFSDNTTDSNTSTASRGQMMNVTDNYTTFDIVAAKGRGDYAIAAKIKGTTSMYINQRYTGNAGENSDQAYTSNYAYIGLWNSTNALGTTSTDAGSALVFTDSGVEEVGATALRLTTADGVTAVVTDANGAIVTNGQDIVEGQTYAVTIALLSGSTTPTLTVDGSSVTLTENSGAYTATFIGGEHGNSVVVGATANTPTYQQETGTSGDSDRYVTTLTIQKADNTNAQQISGPTAGGSVYVDRTQTTYQTKPGTELNIQCTAGAGSWMHSFFYIDFDRNGTFSTSYSAEGVNEGSELVTYNAINFSGTWRNSNGVQTSNDLAYKTTENEGSRMPNFTLPSDLGLGKYRARWKTDWEHPDDANALNSARNNINLITVNRGAIIDFTIEIARTVGVSSANTTMGAAVLANHSEASVTSSNPEIVVATPAAGYRFVNWTTANDNQVVSTNPVYVANDATDVNLVANFEAIPVIHTVTVSVDDDCADMGTVYIGTVNTTEVTREHGSSVTLTAQANEGYEFVGWFVAGEENPLPSAGATYTISSVTEDIDLIAKFQSVVVTVTYPISINMSYAATYYADVYVYDMPINADGTVPEGATLYAKKEAWDDPIYYHEAPEGQELYVYVKQELQNINGNQAFVRLSSMTITNDGVATGESLREGYGTGTSTHGKYCFTVGEVAGDIVITGRFDDKLAYIRSITLGYKDPATMSYMGTIGMYVAGQPEGINQTKFATGAVVTLKAQAEPGASFVRWVDVDGVTTLSTSPEYEYGNDVPGDLTILAEFGPNLTINVGGNGGVSNDDNLGYVEIWDAPMEVYALKYGQNTAGSKTPILAGHAPAGATCYGIAGKFPEGYKVPTGMTLPGNDAEGHPILGYDGAVPMGKQLYVYVFSNFDDPERTYAALNGWQILDQLVVRNNDVEADLNKKALNAERPGTSNVENYTYTQSVLEGNAELGYPALGTPYMYTYLAADGHYCYPLNDVVNGEVQITALFDTDGDLSGIDNIEAVEAITGDTEVYTLQGVRVAADNLTPGFYIVRQGGKATKILVK